MIVWWLVTALFKSWRSRMFGWWKPAGTPVRGPGRKTNIGGQPLPFRVQEDPIVGFRTWRVKSTPNGFSLFSLNMPYEWEVDNFAECLKSASHPMTPGFSATAHDDPAPSLSCQCGFYILLEDAKLTEWDHVIHGAVHAYGTVELTGRVIKCQMGYKAEQARILSVMVDAACADRNEGYCEANVAHVDPQTMRAYCDPHAPNLPLADAGTALPEIRRQLERRYEGVEVLTWLI